MAHHVNLLGLVLAMAIGPASAASQFFLPCGSALATQPFHRLQEFYADHATESQPDRCFRLNDREFLVTVSDTGRVAQGLYYFDADAGTYVFPDGAYRESISIKREFDGPNKKHFALIETSNLRLGNWSVSYEILFLKPGKGGRPFQLQRLLSASEDPEVGMCGTHISQGAATSIVSVDVENEGTAGTMLVFVIKSQKCPNGEQWTDQRRFEWSSGSFAEIEQGGAGPAPAAEPVNSGAHR
jgi:hypothetical protein